MSFIIALCLCNDAFKKNKLIDHEYAKKFPGAEWVSYLFDIANREKVQVLTGDIVIHCILNKKFSSKKVYVIQEMDAKEGEALIQMGANPFLLICLESPLYAYKFYDKINRIASLFKYRMLYKFAYEKIINDKGKNLILKFPSYNSNDIKNIKKWEDKKFLVMVAANKYYKNEYLHYYENQKYKNMLRKIKNIINYCISYNMKMSYINELHNYRLKAISYFGKNDGFDLYGPGWDKTNNIPKNYRNNINYIINKNKPQICENKIDLISKYKYAICFENISIRGYFTEKIIDCFVSGTIPIYCGAPDIDEYIPKNAYIDANEFNKFEDLYFYLKNMPKDMAYSKIQSGREYLCNENNKIHMHCEFANFIYSLFTHE